MIDPGFRMKELQWYREGLTTNVDQTMDDIRAEINAIERKIHMVRTLNDSCIIQPRGHRREYV